MTQAATKNGWKETTLGEVMYPVSDTFNLKIAQEVHFLNTGDILDGKLLHEESSDTSNLPGQAKKSFKRGDILYSEIRPENKRFMLVDFDATNSVASTKLMVLRAKDNIDVKFLYQFLTSDDTVREFQTIAVSRSGTFPQITFDAISYFPILLPSLLEQRAIAAILSSFDDKIELLRKQNQTSEALAQGLFKEWFVDFNFPDEQGKPYKKSGEKMIDGELGEIPNDWEIGRFTDIADVLSGGTPKTDIEEYWNGNIPFFTPKDAKETFYTLVTEKTITQEGLKKCNSRLFPRNTVFITARGTVGKVCLSSCGMAMNQSCYALRGKNISNLFLFLLTKKLIENFQKVANGGVFDAIVVETFESMEIVIPNTSTIESFEQIIQPIFNKILSNSLQIQTLTTLRDQLLPRLMRGEIRINNH